MSRFRGRRAGFVTVVCYRMEFFAGIVGQTFIVDANSVHPEFQILQCVSSAGKNVCMVVVIGK